MKEFIEKLIGRLEENQEIYRGMADACKDILPRNFYFGKMYSFAYAISIVNELAEEYNGGWIPCSERLPEANQVVLTCTKDGWISVNVNIPYSGKKNDFECGYYLAWMPLPEKYKGE